MQVEDATQSGSDTDSSADNGTTTERTYTADELERAKRGIVKAQLAAEKRAAELEARLAKYEQDQSEANRKRAEAAGEHEKLWQQERAEKEQALNAWKSDKQQLEELRAEKAARLEAYKEKAEELVKKVPKQLRALIPQALDASPEEKYQHIQTLLESISTTDTGDGFFGAGVRPPAPEQSDAEKAAARRERMMLKALGINPDKEKK